MVEAVLSRSFAGDHSPYRWLARAVSAASSVVLDLACGSGPMSRELAQDGRMVVGLDLSADELALAAAGSGALGAGRHPGAAVRGRSVDAVTSSIGLVVVSRSSG